MTTSIKTETTTTATTKSTATLYERIGGELAIMAAVERFYARVLSDPLLRPFFENLDMVAQSRKMVGFAAWAFAGPEAFKGRDLRSAHARLVAEKGLSDEHFDATAAHLRAVLEELKVAPGPIDEAMAIVESVRAAVLNR